MTYEILPNQMQSDEDKVQQNELRYDYNLAKNKINKCLWERNFGVYIVHTLQPKHYIRSIAKEAEYLLVTIKMHLKYENNAMFNKLFTARTRPVLEYPNKICWSKHFKKHTDLIKKDQWKVTKMVPEV